MGVTQNPTVRRVAGALLGMLLLLPEIEMRGQSSGGPTFSDANWTALGAGVNNTVSAVAISGSHLSMRGAFFRRLLAARPFK